MAVKINSFEDMRVKDGQILNKSVLNNAFQMLLQNDAALMNENDYRPNIWECRWWNNSDISGYNVGDVCWRNCVTYRQFVDRAWRLVKNYVDKSRDLSGYLVRLDDDGLSGEEREQAYRHYYNVISGYYNDEQRDIEGRIEGAEALGNPGRQALFDIGDYSRSIEMYVSRYDGNKEPLDVTSAWQPLVFNELSDFRQFIQEQVDEIFSDHLHDYHYSDYDGRASWDDVSANFLKYDLTNLNTDNIGCQDIQQGGVTTGFDYVQMFAACNGKWLRKWKSGYVEYGGVVSGSVDDFDSTDTKQITVDLTTNLNGIGVSDVYGAVVSPSCGTSCVYSPDIFGVQNNTELGFYPAYTGKNVLTAYSYYIAGKANV